MGRKKPDSKLKHPNLFKISGEIDMIGIYTTFEKDLILEILNVLSSSGVSGKKYFLFDRLRKGK